MKKIKEFAFRGGNAPTEGFPVQAFADAGKRVLIKMGRELAYYPENTELCGYSNKGYLDLREVASRRFVHREGVPLPVENISLTAGSDQAIAIVARTLIQPGDTIITEELTFMYALTMFRYLKPNIVGVPLDDIDGMDIEALESTLKCLARANVKPKFIYTCINHQNPTGAILSLPRRRRMLELAEEYDLYIVEDDCYGDIDFEPDIIPPSLYAMDDSNRVIFISTFSKILGAGLRQGYFCGPDKIMEQSLDHRFDSGTSMLASAIVAEYLRENMWSQIARQCAIVKEKCDVILGALEKNLGDCATWTHPRGGLYVWVNLPEKTDLKKLEKLAERSHVSYSPGRVFHARGENIKGLRLSYTHMSRDEICEGVELLGRCVHEAQAK